MPPIVAKVVGIPTKFAWGQVHSFAPDELRLMSHGLLTCSFSLDLETEEGPAREEALAVDVGHEIITRCNEEYYGKDVEGETPFGLLKTAVSRVAEEFADIKLEIVASVVWGKYIYFCTFDNSRVYLVREGRVSSILSGRERAIGSCSGEYRTGDIFIFATSSFFEKVGSSVILEAVKQTAVQDIADSIAPYAHRQPVPTLAVAITKAPFREDASEGQAGLVSSGDKEETAPGDQLTSESVSREQKDEDATREEYASGVRILLEKEKGNKFKELFESVKSKFAYPTGIDVAKNRKTAVSVGLILLALLLASIGFGIQQKKVHDYKASYEQQLTDAETAYSDALLQIQVNAPLARDLYSRAKRIAEELMAKGIKDPRLETLREKLAQDAVLILGKIEANTQTFLDLSLVRSGLMASGMLLDNGNLVVLDRAGKRVVLVSISSKQTTVLGNPDKISDPKFVASLADRYYIFDTNGVLQMTKKGSIEQVVKEDDEWGEIRTMNGFGNNLYLLDKGGKIWRYTVVDKGFGTKQDWLKTSADLGNVQDTAIDGSIWVMLGDGAILKLTRGSKDNFAVGGVEQPIKQPDAFYTDENLENIYVLEKANNRIVEIDKNGQFKKEYVSAEIGSSVDLAVSKEAGKIFLLTESKILEIPLR